MEEHERTLVDWLKAHGPDDWHQVAIDWNWDAGVAVMAWIAAQPDCDRATAQDIIVKGGADYYLRFADRADLMAREAVNIEAFDLLVPIIARWNAGGYVCSQIASYEPQCLGDQERRHREAEAANAGRPQPFVLDASVFQPLAGRQFAYLYVEGWPPEVEADLRSRGVSY